jgi:predicted small lipoprotein YifL
MRGKIIPLLLFLLFTTSVAACGNKGPLTLPDEEKKTEKPD